MKLIPKLILAAFVAYFCLLATVVLCEPANPAPDAVVQNVEEAAP